jgi:hypothetical protein
MSNEQPKDRRSHDIDAHRKGGDVMHGRSLAGAEYGANEEEQTHERERAGRDHTDEVGEITETELDDDEV